MLDSKKIHQLFVELNTLLKKEGEVGEIGIVGGAVMCLVFNARKATKDIDAIFEPTHIIRRLAQRIGEQHGLGSDWLNDAAKGFIQGQFGKETILDLSNLRIWAPETKYMLAMKCVSARWDTHDRDDVLFLVQNLELKTANDVFRIIESYYPKKKIPAKTQFLIEEIFETQPGK